MNDQFHFTITDVARFFGKSPVTLRSWESKGLVDWPRDGADRKLTTVDIRRATATVLQLKRISARRARLIDATMTLLDEIERYDSSEDRPRRSTRFSED